MRCRSRWVHLSFLLLILLILLLLSSSPPPHSPPPGADARTCRRAGGVGDDEGHGLRKVTYISSVLFFYTPFPFLPSSSSPLPFLPPDLTPSSFGSTHKSFNAATDTLKKLKAEEDRKKKAMQVRLLDFLQNPSN